MNLDYDERQIEFHRIVQSIKKASFKYNAKKHIYTLDDKQIPSVTGIISAVWKNRYVNVSSEHLELTQLEGKILHKLFRKICEGEPPTEWLEKNKEYQKIADNFTEFIKDYEIQNIQAEFPAWINYRGVSYGFCIDNLSKYGWGAKKGLLLDYKSGVKQTDYENVQTAAYLGSYYMYNRECTNICDRDLKVIDENWVRMVYYTKTNKFRAINNLKDDWRKWNLVLETYKNKNKEAHNV